MFISKFTLENPDLNIHEIGPVLMERAQRAYNHFEQNNLFYINAEENHAHLFFDGDYVIEVSRDHVNFRSDIDPSAFYEFTVGDVTMVKCGRHIKPAIYHPIFNDDYVRPVGKANDCDVHILTKYPGFSEYCLYNRSWGWTVQLTETSYPFAPGMSISMHTVKMRDWFKEKYNILSLVKTRHFGKQVTQFRFIW